MQGRRLRRVEQPRHEAAEGEAVSFAAQQAVELRRTQPGRDEIPLEPEPLRQGRSTLGVAQRLEEPELEPRAQQRQLRRAPQHARQAPGPEQVHR